MNKSIVQVRADVAAKHAELERLSIRLSKLGTQRREVANRIRGMPAPGKDHPERQKLLDTLNRENAELASLDGEIEAANEGVRSANNALKELAGIRFGEDEMFTQSLADYDAAKQQLSSLQEVEREIGEGIPSAKAALSQARGGLSAAQSRTAKALSIAAVAQNAEEVVGAKLRITNAEALLLNLERERSLVRARIDVASKELAKAEAAVFKAHYGVILRDLRLMPEFGSVFAKLEEAYAAYVAAGHIRNFGGFAASVFLGEGARDIDGARLALFEAANRERFFNVVISAGGV